MHGKMLPFITIFGLIALTLSCSPPFQFLTPTATVTSTITNTPTRTPSPTKTITPTRTPAPDYKKAVIVLEDLSKDFQVLDNIFPPYMGGYESAGSYTYGNSHTGQIIAGDTFILRTSNDQFEFKLFLNNPDRFSDDYLKPSRNDQFELKDVIKLEGIGETSAGFRGILTVDGIKINLDIAAVQRRQLGGVIASFNYPHSRPEFTIEDLARMLDVHFMEILPEEPVK